MKNRRRNNMKLKNRIKYAGMAAALALSLTTPTFATPGLTQNTNPNKYDYKQSAKGSDTIISVYETEVHTGNLSVEVPLYLTLAVVKEPTTAAQLVAPDNYYIKNTSKAANGNDVASYSVGITGVHIDSLSGGWTLADYATTPTGTSKTMTLNFTGNPWFYDNTQVDDGTGNMVDKGWTAAAADSTFGFPVVGDGQSFSVDTFLKGTNLFSTGTANNGNNTYHPIPPAHALAIAIDGKVASGYTLDATRKGQAAVPQFRVTYTVSALDDDNQPIGQPYAGPIYGPFPNAGLLTDADKAGGNIDSNFTDSKPNP